MPPGEPGGGGVESLVKGLIYDCFRLVDAVGGQIGPGEVLIGKRVVGLEPERLLRFLDSPLEISDLEDVADRQVVVRGPVPGIGPLPKLVGLVLLVQVAEGGTVVVGGDIEPLELADPIPELEGSLSILECLLQFEEDAVRRTQAGMGDGELGIELDGALEERNGLLAA